MQQENRLGIFFSKDTATAVLLSGHGQSSSLLDAFTIAITPEQKSQGGSLSSLITQHLAQKNLIFAEVYACLDCAMFTQHNIRSEFTEPKQIAGTIRFDAEEAIASDAGTVAVAFEITDIDQAGSNVTVFTADRQFITDILVELHSAGLDPITIEPDIICIARFLDGHYTADNQTGRGTVFVIPALRSCYLISFTDNQNAPAVRSFLLDSTPDITGVLARQIPLTMASLGPARTASRIVIAGNTKDIDTNALKQATGLDVQLFDIYGSAGLQSVEGTNCPAEAHLAAACGTAVVELKKTARADFRRDFMPYQGKRLLVQKTLRILSIAATVLIAALGIYFQLQLFKTKSYVRRLDQKIASDFASAMRGRTPPPKGPAYEPLSREYNTLKRLEQGLGPGDDNSISSKLTFILEAVNNSPKTIDLLIKEISVTSGNMRIRGETSSRAGTLELFKAIENHPKLKKSSENIRQEGNRDSFIVNIELKK